MNYSEAMNYILSFSDYEREPGQAFAPAKYNLERVYLLMEALGNPQDKFKCIHITGTKGKGSTAAMIASALSYAGYKTALFTSPHLHTFRERIRIDGKLITEEQLAEIVSQLRQHVDSVHEKHPDLGRLTTFEITAAVAFTYFALQHVDFAVIEVGLGGRLDATNVVTPLVSVITPISLDHTQILGGTLGEVAREKAGIIKSEGIAVVAPQAAEALEVIRQTADERDAKLLLVGSDWHWREDWNERGEPGDVTVHGLYDKYVGLRIPLLGHHQVVNAATAIATLECLRFYGIIMTADQLREGISLVKWPGRLEMVNWMPRVLVDGAHNVDSMARLREALEDLFHYRHLILILGTSVDKDIAGIVREIPANTHHIIVTKSKHPRSASPDLIARAIEHNSAKVTVADEIPAALRSAMEMAGSKDLIVATGSLFVVAEAREFFGLNEG